MERALKVNKSMEAKVSCLALDHHKTHQLTMTEFSKMASNYLAADSIGTFLIKPTLETQTNIEFHIPMDHPLQTLIGPIRTWFMLNDDTTIGQALNLLGKQAIMF
jgi:hypothetical protein